MTRRRAFRDERYWGRPMPGWGSERPRLLIVGLAPAAHGGNRTGRIFTGDRSGDFLFASLYRTGFAVQPTSVAAGDGQRLVDARMAAAVRCAPPDNKPFPAERDTCAPWLVAELGLVAADLRVIVCLGGFAWQAMWPVLGRCGFALPRPRPAFGHGAEVRLTSAQAPDGVLLIGCYHPSQQNTFTGRVTPAMLDAIFTRARTAAGLGATTQLLSANVDHVISYALHFFLKDGSRPTKIMASVLVTQRPAIVRAVLWARPRSPRAEAGPLKGSPVSVRFRPGVLFGDHAFSQLINAVPGETLSTMIN